jgi:hypothetical protein
MTCDYKKGSCSLGILDSTPVQFNLQLESIIMASDTLATPSVLEEKARKIVANLAEVSSNTFDYVIVGEMRSRAIDRAFAAA